MKIRSSSRELTGCYKVRQVFGHDGMDFAYRSNETAVRWGNDANGAIDGRPVTGLSIRIQESRILNSALRMRKTGGPGQLHQRPGPPARTTRIV
jgi:hypothetical protein